MVAAMMECNDGRYGGSNDGMVASHQADGKNYRIVRNHHGSQTLRFCREDKAAIFDCRGGLFFECRQNSFYSWNVEVDRTFFFFVDRLDI